MPVDWSMTDRGLELWVTGDIMMSVVSDQLHGLKGKQVRILYDLVTVLREYISICHITHGGSWDGAGCVRWSFLQIGGGFWWTCCIWYGMVTDCRVCRWKVQGSWEGWYICWWLSQETCWVSDTESSFLFSDHEELVVSYIYLGLYFLRKLPACF